MAIHVCAVYTGGRSIKEKSQLPGGKALIEIGKDNTWKLQRTSADWWEKGEESRAGTWSGDSSRMTFYGKNREQTFVLRNFWYPPEIGGGGPFFALWDSDAFQDSHYWFPLLTDELLRETIEELDRLQEEIKIMGLQGSLDAVSLFEPTGSASLASAGISLSRGAYVDALMNFGSALPFLGKFAALGLKSSHAAHLAMMMGRVKVLQKGVEVTSEANKSFDLAGSLGRWNVVITETKMTQPLQEFVEIEKAAKVSSKTTRNRAGVIPLKSDLKNKTQGWLGLVNGQAGNALVIPQKMADVLAGRSFQTFDDLRKAFWKEIAANEKLADLRQAFNYDARNLSRMRQGKAPYVKLEHQCVTTRRGTYYKNFATGTKNGQLEVKQVYTLHHKTPIHKEGDIYNLENLVVVTPKYHLDILLRSLHFKAAGR